MLLRQAGGAAARLAASSSSAAVARSSPLLLPALARPRQEQQLSTPRAPAAAVAASRVVAVTARAAAPSSRGFASSSSSPTAATALSPADHHAVIQLVHSFDDYLNRGRHDEIGVFFVGGGGDAEKSGSRNGSNGSNGATTKQQQPQAVVRVLQPGAANIVTHAGVPAIVAFFRACAPMARGNRHLLLNSLVEELEPSSASAGEGGPRVGVRSARLLVSATNPPALRASGVIEDVLVRTGSGEWRILSRDLLMDPPAGAAPAA